MRRHKHGPKEYVPSIAARAIDGHLLRTTHHVYAWYRLSAHRWSFRSDQQREQLIAAIAGQYAELQGRWLHLRVTNRPYPIRQWAEAHVHNAHHRLPDTGSGLSFDDYVLGEQQQLLGRSMAEKEVYLGVQVQTRTVIDRAAETAAPLLRRLFPEAVDAELTALDGEIAHLDHVLAGPGLAARPVTAEEMRWLLHRSATLGLPAPSGLPTAGDGRWATEDLAAIDDTAVLTAEPYAPTVTVTGRSAQHAGQSRQVAVLSVGLAQPLEIPEDASPWMQSSDRLPAPVEWSARIYVRRPGEVEAELQRQSHKIKSQQRHYEDEHELDSPLALQRQAASATEIDDAMSSGFTALSTRVRSWWRVAVSGDTEQEALAHAQSLVDLYNPQMALEHPEGQRGLAREFLPGEPLAAQVHTRRAPVTWAASAVPQATSEVGDRRGVLLGETDAATRRPVAWDPWLSQEVRNGSGLTAVVGGLGAGKSFLGGGIVYKTLRTGAQWTLLDPSGPLAELCQLPELAPYARAINLLHAESGILNPYRVVVEPDPAAFSDHRDYVRELNEAHATRRQLVSEVLTNVLPLEIARQPATKAVILEAVRAVGGRADAHPGLVIDALTSRELAGATEHPEHARTVWRFLDEVRERLALLIPDSPEADPYAQRRDDRLTVLTMAGLTLPKDGVGREHWTDGETIGVELLNLAAWLTQRSVYDGPPGHRGEWQHQRKGVWIDEAFFLSEVPTGRVLMNRFARDSRKWNVRVLLSSQVPQDFLRVQQGFTSLLDSVFVGRLTDETVQSDALRLLGVQTGVGYEPVLGHLGGNQDTTASTGEPDHSPRQFLFADGTGGVERIRIDFSGSHLDHLRRALDTTPGQPPRAPAASASSASPTAAGNLTAPTAETAETGAVDAPSGADAATADAEDFAALLATSPSGSSRGPAGQAGDPA